MLACVSLLSDGVAVVVLAALLDPSTHHRAPLTHTSHHRQTLVHLSRFRVSPILTDSRFRRPSTCVSCISFVGVSLLSAGVKVAGLWISPEWGSPDGFMEILESIPTHPPTSLSGTAVPNATKRRYHIYRVQVEGPGNVQAAMLGRRQAEVPDRVPAAVPSQVPAEGPVRVQVAVPCKVQSKGPDRVQVEVPGRGQCIQAPDMTVRELSPNRPSEDQMQTS